MDGYSLDHIYTLVFRNNIFSLLIPLLDKERCSDVLLTIHCLHILEKIFYKEAIMTSREFYLNFERMGGVDLLEDL